MAALPRVTQRLILRKFTRQDLPAFVAYRNHPEVARYQSWSSYTAEDAEAFYAQQAPLGFDEDESWFQVAAEHTVKGVLTGDVAVHFFDEGRQAELGVTFDLEWQRQGLAHEAVASVVALLFADLGKHRLTATVDVLNFKAQRLLEKLGFRREAHYRENIFFKGVWSDEFSYALLASEWRARQHALATAAANHAEHIR